MLPKCLEVSQLFHIFFECHITLEPQGPISANKHSNARTQFVCYLKYDRQLRISSGLFVTACIFLHWKRNYKVLYSTSYTLLFLCVWHRLNKLRLPHRCCIYQQYGCVERQTLLQNDGYLIKYCLTLSACGELCVFRFKRSSLWNILTQWIIILV